MRSILNIREARIRWLLPVLVCFITQYSRAQATMQVFVNNFYYNCSTGQLNVSYRVVNNDGFNTQGLQSNYGMKIGGISVQSRFTSSSIQSDTYIGPYTPGDQVLIWAQGTGNNSTPYNSYTWTPAPAGTVAPVTPVISNAGSSSLCAGQTTTLVASGASGTILWSNGMTGSSIVISAPGNYTAVSSGGCGSSGSSNIVTIDAGSIPAAPAVNASGATLLCDGNSIILSASSTGGGSIYWNTGQPGNSISVNSAGTFYAYEINGCGQSDNSNSITTTTSSTPAAPTILPAGPVSLCNGASVTLTIPGGGSTTWYHNGSLIASNGGTQTVSQAGSYAAKLSNACGVSVQSPAVVITTGNVPSAPSVSPAGSQLLCNGWSTTLTASGSDIIWSNGSTGNTLNVSTAGNYYAVDRNACGNSAQSNTVIITTGNCPTPSPGTSFYTCPGTLKTLDAGAGYESYLWSTGATTRTISVGPGAYAVTVTKEGCTATSSTITVANYSVNAALINPSGPTTFCAGGSVTLSASAGNAWSWNTGASLQSINVSVSGSYYVTVTDPNGCTATSSPIAVTVRDLPTASISGNNTVCKGAAAPVINLTANGGVPPYTFTYNINGGSNQTVTTTGGNSISVSVPTSAAGTFSYNLVSVRESSSTACANNISGTATVVVKDLPAATISGSTTVCRNSSAPKVIFTGSGGQPPYAFSYRINGSSAQTVVTTIGNSVSVNVPTDVAGTYQYELLGVQEASGQACSGSASGTATVVVRPLPGASISGNATVCRNSTSPLVTFTGNNGSGNYTFYYRVNNGALQSVTTTSGSSVTVAVPTSTDGNYTYSLVSVSESSIGCANAASGDVIVTVRGLPEATISGSTTICQNGTAPSVVFTGSGGTAPYTFSYRINNGAVQTVSTSTGNSVSVTVPSTTAGNFTYSLVSVKESGTGTCEQAVSGSATVTINPQPVKAVIAAPNMHLCNGETGTISVFNWVAGNTYTWYRNGVLFTTTSSQTINITQAGAYTVMVSTPEGCSASGLSNTINITTGTVPTPVITGKLKVCEGGKTLLDVIAARSGEEFEAWRWMLEPEGNTLSNSKSFSAAAGQYRVRVMREGCYDNATVSVTPNDTEFPAGQLTISPQSIPYGGKATLVANVTGAASYEWDLGDNRKVVTLSNTMTQNYFVQDDSVHVKVRAISERNCIAEFTASLKVEAPGENVIIDRSWIGNLKDWNLFPNPFHDNLKASVILKRNETIRFDLFTADGAWVKGWVKTGRKGENLFQLEGVETLAANVVYIITAIYNGERHADKIYRY
jgi:hypothetical protein